MQQSLVVAKILLFTDAWKNRLKHDLRYWKLFVIYNENTNTMTYIFKFKNQGNKVKFCDGGKIHVGSSLASPKREGERSYEKFIVEGELYLLDLNCDI